jgi:hypothetical protein
MLIAMDGNESLKRMGQATTTSTNTEQMDFRDIPSDMYLPADKVDIFKYEVKSRHTMLSMVTIYFTLLLNFLQLAWLILFQLSSPSGKPTQHLMKTCLLQ